MAACEDFWIHHVTGQPYIFGPWDNNSTTAGLHQESADRGKKERKQCKRDEEEVGEEGPRGS